MIVHPVINCTSIACFRKRAFVLASFVKKHSCIHVDIGKKPFVSRSTSVCARTLRALSSRIDFAGHLMSTWNRNSFRAYLRMPFKLLFLHASEVHGDELAWACAQSRAQKKKLGLVIVVGESVHALSRVLNVFQDIKQVLVLSVHPGSSGQRFHSSALRTISFLKKNHPRVTITVDGGIKPALLRKVARAGAHAITSGSYIWSNKNPAHAYSTLQDF